MNKIIIATRNSQLALYQANQVKQLLLEKTPHLNIELLALSSEGDDKKDVALNTIGGKDLFAKRIQQAVIDKQADISVHSLKDLGVNSPAALSLTAFLARADARDALVSFRFDSLTALPPHAIVGTASPRRECLLKAWRPDLNIKLIRGNVTTRLAKCEAGEYDAIILAAAGLQRLNLTQHIKQYLNPESFIPAIGQGIIAAECRRDDVSTQALLRTINDADSEHCALAERAVNQVLGGDCFTPIGAFATVIQDELLLRGFYADAATRKIKRGKVTGSKHQAVELGQRLGRELKNG